MHNFFFQKAVLDLLYDLLCLAQPEWSDEISVAIDAVDPSRYQESFKLSDGFVAAEGRTVLPHISKSRYGTLIFFNGYMPKVLERVIHSSIL